MMVSGTVQTEKGEKMRLIDADTIFNNKVLLVRTECYDAVRAVIERINNAPTVDAVEVVRCKDCKWHRTIELYAVGDDRVPYEITSECLKWHDDVPVDFYCGWGERREDGEIG